MVKYRIRNNTFLGEFLTSFINNDPNNVLINAYNNFPHAVPLMTGFNVTELSKEILRNYNEAIIRNQGVIFEDVDLPFIYSPEDYMIIYDTYTLFDNENQNSILVNNFFYITKVHNFGAAWSMFEGGRYLLIIIAVCSFMLLFHYEKFFRYDFF